MQPTTSRDFQRAALQRLTTAEALLGLRLNLDAQYLGGYTVECSLKALILEQTPPADKADTLKRSSSGATMHRRDVLLGKLTELGVVVTLELGRRLRGC